MGQPENELIKIILDEIIEEFPENKQDLNELGEILKRLPVPIYRILGKGLSKAYKQWITRLTAK